MFKKEFDNHKREIQSWTAMASFKIRLNGFASLMEGPMEGLMEGPMEGLMEGPMKGWPGAFFLQRSNKVASLAHNFLIRIAPL